MYEKDGVMECIGHRYDVMGAGVDDFIHCD